MPAQRLRRRHRRDARVAVEQRPLAHLAARQQPRDHEPEVGGGRAGGGILEVDEADAAAVEERVAQVGVAVEVDGLGLRRAAREPRVQRVRGTRAVRPRAPDHLGGEREPLRVETVEAPLRQRADVVQGGERGAERAQRRREVVDAVEPVAAQRLEDERAGRAASGRARAGAAGADRRCRPRPRRPRRWRARARRRPSGPSRRRALARRRRSTRRSRRARARRPSGACGRRARRRAPRARRCGGRTRAARRAGGRRGRSRTPSPAPRGGARLRARSPPPRGGRRCGSSRGTCGRRGCGRRRRGRRRGGCRRRGTSR